MVVSVKLPTLKWNQSCDEVRINSGFIDWCRSESHTHTHFAGNVSLIQVLNIKAVFEC